MVRCRLGYRALAAEVETLGWMNMADVDTILEPKVEAFVDQVMQLPAVRALLETVDEPSGVPADC